MSEDEGATWPWTRHLDRDEKFRYHYPSMIQAADGAVHATYSYFAPGTNGRDVKSIKHVRFDASWVKG